MPLQRRLPKRGFKNINRKEYAIINVGRLQELPFEEITPERLLQEGVLSSLKDGLKVLGSGQLRRALKVKAHAFSASALRKITQAGGQAEVI
jgi:large subunit ribosomal protein L15